MTKDYYSILGVSKTATEDEIKTAYRKKAIEFHPDKQVGKTDAEKKDAEEKFKDVAEAYQILINTMANNHKVALASQLQDIQIQSKPFLQIQAVPELPVAGRCDIDIGVSRPVEVPGETFLRGDPFDLLKDVQRLLWPVGLAGGLVVLPELAYLRVVPCVFRAIVLHCFRSCE